MKKTLLFDFSNTLLFPKDNSYTGKLNPLYYEHKDKPDFNFWDYFKLNNELVSYLQINQHEFDSYIFTTGRIQEVEEVQEIIKPVFKKIFTVADIKIPKIDPKAYTHIAKQLKIHPNMITFVDDVGKNTNAAQKALLNTIVFTDTQIVIEKLEQLKNITYIDKLAYIHIEDNKILVTLSKGKDTWYIPGGKRELTENDHQALSREVKEELTVDIIPESIKHYGTFEAQAHGKPEGTIVRMTCYQADFTGKLNPSAEIDKIDFFNYEQKSKTSPVDNIIFDDLKSRNLIS